MGDRDGDDEAIRKRDVERKMLWLDVERELALVAPALKFHEAIALACRVALRQRQAARLGEDAAEEDRLVVDVELVPSRDVHEMRVADIGPGTDEREIIVDGPWHI